ncbi:hypothetical protein M8J76_000066 [Diaphorina citri]|nr:hypothetical protein M8J76_000066 [Diaphorina citri]
MREEMGEWRFCLVFLLAIVTSTAASGCPQDSPDRNLLCYQTKFTEEELDPCLCTHWVLTREHYCVPKYVPTESERDSKNHLPRFNSLKFIGALEAHQVL